MKNFFLIVAALVFVSSTALAGIYEISATYNYKKTNYDTVTYEESESGTASLAYYFWGLSGLEISFTRGASVLAQPQYFVYQDLTGYGLSLLFTIANTGSSLKPYVKGGVAYIIKSIRYIWNGSNPLPAKGVEGIAPSVGLGFKIAIGPQFEIKAGIDASTSPLNSSSSITYDFGLNAGLGFLF